MNEFSGAPRQTRRTILKGAVGIAVLGLGGVSLMTDAHAAADAKAWPDKAFTAKGEADSEEMSIAVRGIEVAGKRRFKPKRAQKTG